MRGSCFQFVASGEWKKLAPWLVFVPYAGKLFSILFLRTHALCDLNGQFAAESQFFFFEYFVFCIHMLFPHTL